MRWIDRGPDPAEIAGYSQQYTQGWIDYYNGKDLTGRHTLPEPEDHEWSYYSETLGKQSVKNCWYCERRCQAVGGWALTVDHFRPGAASRNRLTHGLTGSLVASVVILTTKGTNGQNLGMLTPAQLILLNVQSTISITISIPEE